MRLFEHLPRISPRFFVADITDVIRNVRTIISFLLISKNTATARKMSLNASNYSDSTTSPLLLNRVKFGIFLTLQIPSLVCSLYLFFQYATRKNLRQSIHNDVVLVLLCSSFVFVAIPISISEAFFFASYVQPASNLFCAIWTWIHYSANVGNLILMAFACTERHWILFRLNSMNTRRIRMMCHYIPIAVCMLYPSLLYFILIFLYPCEPVYDFTQLLCVIPCYFFSSGIANFDTFFNNWAPIFAIPVLSGTLFARFLVKKRQMRNEAFRWKRDRKMVIQLLTITSLYLFMWSPVQVATVYDYVRTAGLPSQFEVDYLYSLPYFIHLLYPFVIFFSNSEFRSRPRIVAPQGTHQLRQTKTLVTH